MRIIQMVPSISYGDGVSNTAFAIKDILKEMGYNTQIYAEVVDKKIKDANVKTLAQLDNLDKEDIVIYHFCIGNDLNHFFANMKCRKVMLYHNVTTPELVKEDDPHLAYICWRGLDDASEIRNKIDYCITFSDYSKEELINMGYKCPIDVVPIPIPFKDYKKKPNEELVNKIKSENNKNIIFVGRIVSHKKQENIIAAFDIYRRYYNKDAKLTLVGGYNKDDNYKKRLMKYIQINNIENVKITGHIKFDEILAYYSSADLFVSLSEHEGFGIPLIEAMLFDTPVLAYDKAAVGGTLNGSGFLVQDNSPQFIAGCMNRILSDDKLKEEIIESQRKRLEELSTKKVYEKIKALMNNFI